MQGLLQLLHMADHPTRGAKRSYKELQLGKLATALVPTYQGYKSTALFNKTFLTMCIYRSSKCSHEFGSSKQIIFKIEG